MVSGQSIHGQWSSRLTFILAATGSAVGLGNIWRFPYVAGENGGGAFVLVYLLCVLTIGLPIMMAEILVGRRGRRNPMDSIRVLALADGRSPRWQWAGLLGVLTGTLILSFYAMIGGWTLAYLAEAARGAFVDITPAAAERMLGDLLADPWTMLLWHSVFMGLVTAVSVRGVEGGLDRAAQLLTPGLLLILLAMVGYGLSNGDVARAARFLFAPDFSRLDGEAVLAAMGQAFFSLSLGMGAIMIYGSYLRSDTSIPGSCLAIVAMDTAVALVAGLAFFPVVFANGLDPAEGPGLVFVTLPLALGQMPFGSGFAVLFFLMLAVAAWTSAISLMEPAVAWLVERRGLSRPRAGLVAAGAIWALGIVSILSLNLWSGYTIAGRTAFEALDYLTNNILLPLGGMAVAIFAGWVLSRAVTANELAAAGPAYGAWRLLVRYVSPVAVGVVLVGKLLSG